MLGSVVTQPAATMLQFMKWQHKRKTTTRERRQVPVAGSAQSKVRSICCWVSMPNRPRTRARKLAKPSGPLSTSSSCVCRNTPRNQARAGVSCRLDDQHFVATQGAQANPSTSPLKATVMVAGGAMPQRRISWAACGIMDCRQSGSRSEQKRQCVSSLQQRQSSP